MDEAEVVQLSEVRLARMARKSNADRIEEEDMPRSIRLPKRLWDALDDDADRCKRSSLRQLEALLTLYYELDDIDFDQAALTRTRRELEGHASATRRAK